MSKHKQASAITHHTKKEGIILSSTTAEMHVGPLPHPMILSQYNDVIPNGAERIMLMAEQELKHQQDCDLKMIEYNNYGMKKTLDINNNGQKYAFFLALLLIAVGVLFVYMKQTVIAGVVFGTSLVIVLSAFVAKKSGKEESSKE